MITTAERERITTLVLATKRALEARFDLPAADLPVAWDLRGRTSLGQACTKFVAGEPQSRLRLNVEYASLLGSIYDEVAVHEVCHAVTWQLWHKAGKPIAGYTSKGAIRFAPAWTSHGKVWRGVMHAAGFSNPRSKFNVEARGIENTVTPVSTRRTAQVTCACASRPVYDVTPAKATRLVSSALCRNCRMPFVRV